MLDTESSLIKPRLEDARSYLVDWLTGEDIHGEESRPWFEGLAGYARQLPLGHVLIRRAAVFLRPFLEEDERIQGVMHRGGEAFQFIDRGWGGDFLEYLTGLIDALGDDYLTWQALRFDDGEEARWA